MLPPAPMLVIKNKIEDGRRKIADGIRFAAIKSRPLFSILHPRLWLLLALAVFLTGCGPPGPRALLKGRKYLERGQYSNAVEEFKTATSLMATNAQAWNYLGVAYQHAGHPADAVLAYQHALALDRDLVEAHYNLGCLWLEQNKPAVAKSEFTTYVLRRSKEPEGWTRLGVAQLRLHDLTSAEKSFSTALSLDTNDAEALNGLGLAQMQRGRPHQAAQYFAAAKKAQPDYAPAWLNLATVEQQYLHDDRFALQNYRAYLALTPRRPDWEQVNVIASNLDQEVNGPATPPRPSRPAVSTAPQASERKTPPISQTPTVSRPRTYASQEASPPEVSESETTSTAVTHPSVAAKTPPRPTSQKPAGRYPFNPLNWFRSKSSTPKTVPSSPANTNSKPTESAPEVSPGPATAGVAASGTPAQTRPAKPFHMVQPAPPSFPRYLYLSPPKPRPGDRRAAGPAFARAQQFEREKRYQDALDSYREAAQLDPGWFEAQYNCGVVAYRLRDFDQSLRAYEMALAIRPDSTDARYNFALALRAAGYVPDAVNELKKIIEVHPDSVRAHLALGNLYAQQLYDTSQARAQYRKVLQLDPGNPQAADIQFWLSANPP